MKTVEELKRFLSDAPDDAPLTVILWAADQTKYKTDEITSVYADERGHLVINAHEAEEDAA